MAARNVTLSLPEDLVRRAKILAASRDTSMSSLVADLLRQATSQNDDYDDLWAAEERLMAEGIGLEVGEIGWSRDELHDR